MNFQVLSYPMTMKNDANYASNCVRIHDEIRGAVGKDAHSIAAFSVYTWNLDAIIEVCNRLRISRPKTRVIWGGPEVCLDFINDGVFDSLPVDYLVLGEGEITFKNFLDALVSGDAGAIKKIANLAERVDGTFTLNAVEPAELDLGGIPSPVLLGRVDGLLSRPGMRANIETQRGCNFRCAYCFYHKSYCGIRYRDPELVLREILHAYRKGCTAARITDANFASRKDHALAIMNGLVQHGVKMILMTECLPQSIDEEIADSFGRFIAVSPENKLTVGIGLQSLNEKSMKTIRRHINKKYFESAFELLKMNKAIIKSDIILGLPYETKETYLNSIDFLVNLQRDGYNLASVGLLRVLPGTDLVAIAEETGLVYDRNDSEHYIYSTPDMPRQDMLYCLKVTTVVSRIISARDIESKIRIKDRYFRVKDSLGVSNSVLLRKLVTLFDEYLSGKESDYNRPDFPNAEYYYCYRVDSEVPDDVVNSMLNRANCELRLA